MEAFKEKFKEEARELIAELEHMVLKLEGNRTDNSIVEEVFRVMHSLKGGSAMFGFTLIDKFTHLLENIYDKIRAGEYQVTDDILDITLNAVDHLRNLIEETPKTVAQLEKDNNKFIEQIENILSTGVLKSNDSKTSSNGNSKEISKHTKTYFVRFEPSADFFQDGSNPLFLIDDIWQLGKILIVPIFSKIPKYEKIDPIDCYMSWNLLVATDDDINAIMDVFIFTNKRSKVEVAKLSDNNLLAEESHRKTLLETLSKNYNDLFDKLSAIALDFEKAQNESDPNFQRQRVQSTHSSEQTIASIRVSSEKLDNLINWVSELVTIQAQLSLYTQHNQHIGLAPISEEIEKITRRLRDDVFSIRLIPVSNMLTRFQRLVRELSHDLDKDIVFESRGTETELDKNIIEMLADPIMHIIRNSIDHGIEESAEERVKKGKPARGKILFNAYYSGTNVYIQIIDDGKGIDAEKVRAKAIEKDLISSESEISNKELFDFLFLPGFSMAKVVTNLSGRGVGMDVVKRKIADLRGQVEIDSKLGLGTTVTIKLPLTLSIIDGLLVKVENTNIVIPLSSVHKVYEYEHTKIEKAVNNLILADGEQVPIINLRKYFKMKSIPPPLERVVTIEYGEYYMGFTVDEIIGEYQAVLKPLGSTFKEQDFFSGATILGDGTVALVLDPNKLIELFAKTEVKIGD